MLKTRECLSKAWVPSARVGCEECNSKNEGHQGPCMCMLLAEQQYNAVSIHSQPITWLYIVQPVSAGADNNAGNAQQLLSMHTSPSGCFHFHADSAQSSRLILSSSSGLNTAKSTIYTGSLSRVGVCRCPGMTAVAMTGSASCLNVRAPPAAAVAVIVRRPCSNDADATYKQTLAALLICARAGGALQCEWDSEGGCQRLVLWRDA